MPAPKGVVVRVRSSAVVFAICTGIFTVGFVILAGLVGLAIGLMGLK